MYFRKPSYFDRANFQTLREENNCHFPCPICSSGWIPTTSVHNNEQCFQNEPRPSHFWFDRKTIMIEKIILPFRNKALAHSFVSLSILVCPWCPKAPQTTIISFIKLLCWAGTSWKNISHPAAVFFCSVELPSSQICLIFVEGFPFFNRFRGEMSPLVAITTAKNAIRQIHRDNKKCSVVLF